MPLERLGPAPGARCLVVGGCGGIGSAYVEGLLAHGARVAVIDLPVSLSESPLPSEVAAIPADATNEEVATAAVHKAGETFGAFDVFAYVAGINGKLDPIESMRPDDFRTVLEINLYAAFTTSRAALLFLKKSEAAAMVFVSSSLHANAEPGFGAYAASKGGLVSLMKVFAREAAPKVRANAVAPGIVDTPLLSGGTGRGGKRGASQDHFAKMGPNGERIRASIPLGRIAEPEEVAAPMLFLSGPASSYITGQILHINGGRFTP
jgi:NAD(P)-dependent dehydrogenase (short-subunit alcohol dehydrogenase family)